MRFEIFLFSVFLFYLSFATPAHAMGNSDDPAEKISRTFTLEPYAELTIRGQINFTIEPGTDWKIVITTNRAVMDQINVSAFFGLATVAVESGLRGPRERGETTAVITLPRLTKLSVQGQSSGKINWPSSSPIAKVELGEQSALETTFTGQFVKFSTDWKSTSKWQGRTESLEVYARHQSSIDATELDIDTLQVELKEASRLSLRVVKNWGGILRDGSKIVRTRIDLSKLRPGQDIDNVVEPQGSLSLKEGSTIEDASP